MRTVADHPLAIAVSSAVPLLIAEYQSRGGPTDADRERARAFADVLAEQADQLLFRGPKRGDTGRLFAKLADAMAVLAFCPGGVRFAGTIHDATTVVG